MASPGPRPMATPHAGIPGVLLVGAMEFFAIQTAFPLLLSVLVAGTGAGAAILLRTTTGGRRTDAAALVILLALGLLAVGAPYTWGAGLAGGAVVLALLFWLADEPGRVSGGTRRALPAVGVTALAFGIAWVAAFLLPSAPTSAGVVGGILVLVILLAAILFSRTDLIEREPALIS